MHSTTVADIVQILSLKKVDSESKSECNVYSHHYDIVYIIIVLMQIIIAINI